MREGERDSFLASLASFVKYAVFPCQVRVFLPLSPRQTSSSRRRQRPPRKFCRWTRRGVGGRRIEVESEGQGQPHEVVARSEERARDTHAEECGQPGFGAVVGVGGEPFGMRGKLRAYQIGGRPSH
eukprot:4051808-Lingulodinium_polyedra.AAC.1